MRLTAEKTVSTEGRTLIVVRFEREGDDAATPVIETVYETVVPEGLFEASSPILFLLSVTRQDTRETMKLTEEETRLVQAKAAHFAAKLMSED